MLLVTALPAAAQSSATIVRRLTDLEAKVASLEGAVTNLLAKNSSQDTQLTALAAQVASLQNALEQEAIARSSRDGELEQLIAASLTSAKAYSDSKSATSLSQAKTYADEQINPIKDKLVHFSRNGNEIYITGANLNLRSGGGATYQVVNGLGNLTIGYNEARGTGSDIRTGSHNLVLGFGNNYTAAGAILSGAHNSSSNHFSSVIGGSGNTSSGVYSVVVGGFNNVASGNWSTIGGGQNKTASGLLQDLP